MNTTTDRFYLKKGAVRFGKVRVLLGVIISLFAIVFGIIMAQSQTGAGVVVILCGVFFLGVTIYLMTKRTGTNQFVELSPQGININNEKLISWGDVEKVEEEEYEEDYEYLTAKKKKLVIVHVNRQKNVMEKAQIVSDYENYPVIKEKIYKSIR